MEFIKRNYEKIILSLVLLGLVGALGFMPVVIYYDQQQTTDVVNRVTHPHAVPLDDLNLSRQQAALERLQSPYKLDLSSTNKLFNPMEWQKDRDGALIKITTGKEVGPAAAVVAKITPLYFTITLDSVTANELGTRYSLSIEDQSAAIPGQRRKRSRFASKGDVVSDKSVSGKNQGFTLVDVKGPPENPDQLVLKLADTGATNTVSKSQPFRRVDAYSADLRYDLDKPPYVGTALRVGDHLAFGGDNYNVIDINKNEVRLLAQSNQKKFTLPYTP